MKASATKAQNAIVKAINKVGKMNGDNIHIINLLEDARGRVAKYLN